jgi:hypothetical protein
MLKAFRTDQGTQPYRVLNFGHSSASKYRGHFALRRDGHGRTSIVGMHPKADKPGLHCSGMYQFWDSKMPSDRPRKEPHELNLQIGVTLDTARSTDSLLGYAVAMFQRRDTSSLRFFFGAGDFRTTWPLRSLPLGALFYSRRRRGRAHELRRCSLHSNNRRVNCKRHRWLTAGIPNQFYNPPAPGIAFTQALGRVTRMRGRGSRPSV